MSLKVSVVVPVFNPGEHIDPLIESLQRQTMPQSDFETIFVDDGSSDETPEKLDRLAAAQDNVHVIHIPNSGWPGRPRNLGVDAAVGEYVQFVDHDDELGPEALERLYAYATENGSDVVGKEVRRSGKWHASPVFDKNRPRATLEKDPILGILTPHKMFRREFLNKHGLRFFEGPRRMEDHPFVVEAFFLADVISVLSDYPVYYWNRRPDRGNAGARPFDWADYYVYMRDVLDVVKRHTEPGDFRDRLLSFWYDSKGLGVLARNLPRKPRDEMRRHFDALRELAEERFPPSVDKHLHGVMKVRSALLRANDFEGMLALAELERGIHIEQSLSEAFVDDETLTLRMQVRLAYADGSPVTFELDDGRYRWRPPLDIGDAVPAEAFDFSRVYRRRRLELALRSRSSTEIVLVKGTVHTPQASAGPVPFDFDVSFTIDPETVIHGGPLERGVYDVFVRVSCLPWRPHTPLLAADDAVARRPLTAVLSTRRTVVPFSKPAGGIALDVDQKALDLLELADLRFEGTSVARRKKAVVVGIPVGGWKLHGRPLKGVARLQPCDGSNDARARLRIVSGGADAPTTLRLDVDGLADDEDAASLRPGSWEVFVSMWKRRHRLPVRLESDTDGTVRLLDDEDAVVQHFPGDVSRARQLVGRGSRTFSEVRRRVRHLAKGR
jgi:glycosyltransferase involved in cell wall biosynthesis